MRSFRNLACLFGTVALCATGCVISTDDDGVGGSGGDITGGTGAITSGGTGATSTGGTGATASGGTGAKTSGGGTAGSGGASGSGGKVSTGGTTSTGGVSGGGTGGTLPVDLCDPATGSAMSKDATQCCPACIDKNCAKAKAACDADMEGTTYACLTEFVAVQTCLAAEKAKSGTDYDYEKVLDACTSKAALKDQLVRVTTSALIACVSSNGSSDCQAQCFYQ